MDFETDPQIDHWTRHRETHPAVWRAVRLRLFVFGLIAKPTLRSGAEEFPAGPAPVHRRCVVTGPHRHAPGGRLLALLRLLFDLDGLTQGLARDAPAGPRPRVEDIDARDLEEFEQRFLRSVASIELWLRGIQTPLDGGGDPAPIPTRFSIDDTPTFSGALAEFWQSRGRAVGVMGFADRTHTVNRRFFRELRASDAEGEAAGIDGGSC